MRTAVFLFLSFLSGLAFSHDWPPSCERLTQQLWHRDQPAEATARLEAYLGSTRISSVAKNRKYDRFFEVSPKKGHLALAIAFPVVSSLNSFWQTKTKTAAVWGLYRKLFWEELQSDNFLKASMLQSRKVPVFYADFKGIGLLFEKDTPEVREAIKRIQTKILAKFLEAMERLPQIDHIRQDEREILKDPRNWVQWGLGANPLQATVTASVAKFHLGDNVAGLLHFKDPLIAAFYQSRLKTLEQTRLGVVDALKNLPAFADLFDEVFFEDRSSFVPSVRTLEILNAVSHVRDADYFATLSDRMETEFGVKLGLRELQLLKRLYSLTEVFRPRIQERAESSIETASLPEGALYIDVQGQTARNAYQVFVGTAEYAGKASKGAVADTLPSLLRERQRLESGLFEKTRKKSKQISRESGYSPDTRISGDEIIVPILKSTPTDSLSHATARAAEQRVPIRLVEVRDGSGHYGAHHIAAGERLEKDLRVYLKRSGFSSDEVRSLKFGVQLTPVSEISANVRLFVGSSEGHAVVSRVVHFLHPKVFESHEFVLPEGYRMKEITNAHSQF